MGTEMMAAMGMPCTESLATGCNSPMVDFGKLNNSAKAGLFENCSFSCKYQPTYSNSFELFWFPTDRPSWPETVWMSHAWASSWWQSTWQVWNFEPSLSFLKSGFAFTRPSFAWAKGSVLVCQLLVFHCFSTFDCEKIRALKMFLKLFVQDPLCRESKKPKKGDALRYKAFTWLFSRKCNTRSSHCPGCPKLFAQSSSQFCHQEKRQQVFLH